MFGSPLVLLWCICLLTSDSLLIHFYLLAVHIWPTARAHVVHLVFTLLVHLLVNLQYTLCVSPIASLALAVVHLGLTFRALTVFIRLN